MDKQTNTNARQYYSAIIEVELCLSNTSGTIPNRVFGCFARRDNTMGQNAFKQILRSKYSNSNIFFTYGTVR